MKSSTVGELIAELRKFDENMIVVRPSGGPEAGWDAIDAVYEYEVCAEIKKEFETVKVVVLS